MLMLLSSVSGIGARMTGKGALQATAALASLLIPWPTSAFAQMPDAVQRMVNNEVNARAEKSRFVFESDERSERTGGHLWHEHIVETNDGPLRQLTAIDGKPLMAAQRQAERDRLLHAIQHPNELRKAKAAMDADEARTLDLLRNVPKAFTLTPVGGEEGCNLYAFQPNPAFSPASMEERVLTVMSGTISLREPMERLCKLDATFNAPVEFGFGLLGRLEKGGHFLLVRAPIDADNWKSKHIAVHVQGRLLLLKSISKNQDVQRTDVHVLPSGLSLLESERYLK